MGIFDMLKNPALLELVKDQRLKEILTRREIRVSEEYFQREFVSQVLDDEIHELSMKFLHGHGVISGKVKKKLIPFSVNFSARFTVQRVDFSPQDKKIVLTVEQVKPFDLEWVTRRVVEKISFLSYADGIITCDLVQVPRLAEFFDYRLKGFRVCDMLTVKELLFREGELVGRLGLVL